MPFHIDRVLLRALAVSLTAHAVLFAGVARVLPLAPGASTPAVTVSIRQHTAPAPVASAPVSRHTAPAAAPATPVRSQTLARVLAVPEQPIHTEAAPPPVASPSIGEVATEPRAAMAARGPAAGIAAQGDGQMTKAGAADGVAADDVRQYRTSLAIAAKRFKRYPPLARERGWEGKVEVALDFHHTVPGPDVSVASSSGRGILDEQAVEMIRQAARVAEIPERLRGKDFRIVLPVAFSLDDER